MAVGTDKLATLYTTHLRVIKITKNSKYVNINWLFLQLGLWANTRLFKGAEHSFQEAMPYLPLLLSYLCFSARFFARVKVNHRRVYSRILDRWVLLLCC